MSLLDLCLDSVDGIACLCHGNTKYAGAERSLILETNIPSSYFVTDDPGMKAKLTQLRCSLAGRPGNSQLSRQTVGQHGL